MTFDPLLTADFPIAPHAAAGFAALILGGLQLARAKGTPSHKAMGWSWVGLMVFIAGSGFFIHEIRLWGLFSPIHLLAFPVFFGLWHAVRAARRGDIRLHKRIMVQTFALALVITGLFTLLPGRAMHQVLFGG